MAEQGRRERKVVSILFADLVGFTSRAESLDPEDVEAILRPYHARLRSELERHGGTVEKFIGDAVMAVFGAPVAHEDDAERAVRAALAIRDWVRDAGELELRIAVNTGEALVSLGARPAYGEGMVTGDVVNTAARLQSAAPVNGVIVGESTFRATERAIDYRALDPVEAKGKAQPVPVWEAVEARSRFGADVTHPTRSPLVGRARELDVLGNALARAREERAPQLVTLVGVPGIGKSRLVYELWELVDADPELITWRQGRCLPYGEGVAFWALAEMVKANAGILEGEPASTADEKLRAAVVAAIQDAAEADWVVDHLRPLLGLGEGGRGGADARAESFAAWRRFLEALAEQRPLVLVFEDLHWADEGLLDFVDHLVDWATGVPVLVVGTARPELLTRRSGWGGGKSNAVTLSLSPLSERDTAQLLHRLLDRSVLPADVHSLLLERAGGNPLYAEEFARIAGEGRGDLQLPESLQGLIAARLDALTAEEKAILQDAAVVGKVFWLGSVAALGGDEPPFALQERLHALERKEFIRRERRTAVAGDTQYAFGHGLVRDVAYGQIPRAERAEKHRRAAEWIEALGRPDDHAEMLAHHYVNALAAARAAGQPLDGLADAARLAFRDAGDRAAALSAYPAAARFYADALELWPESDDERPKLLFHGAEARFQLTFANEDELVAARDALLAAGDRETAAEAEVMLTNAAWIQGRGDDTLRHLERAAELAADLPPSASKAYVLAGLARFHMLAERDELAEPFVAEALELAEQLDLTFVRATVLNTRGTMRASAGDQGGLEDLEESIALYQEVHSPEVTRAYNNLGFSLLRLGDVRRSSEVAVEGARAAERFGVAEWVRWARDKVLYADFYGGRWDEALSESEALLAEVGGSGHYLVSSWQTLRGHILLARGDEAAAVESATIAIEQARIAGDPQVVAPALAWRARVLAASGERDSAADAIEQLAGLIGTPSASIWFTDAVAALLELGRPDDFERLAKLVPITTRWLVAGRAQAGPDPARAADLYAEMGALPDEADARLHAAHRLVGEGRRGQADAQLGRALAFYRRVRAARYARDAEALLAESA